MFAFVQKLLRVFHFKSLEISHQAGFSLRNSFKGTYISTNPYFKGHTMYRVISGVNCLNFTENIANVKGHQCLSKMKV